MINPGKLDRRLVLQVRVVSKDATGSRVETWADEASIWGEYVTHKGAVSELSDAEKSQDTQQFRIRHRTIAASTHRILYQSRFYTIRSITEEGRQNMLLLDTVATQSAT